MKKLGIWSCVLMMLFAAVVPEIAFAAEQEQISIPVRVQEDGAVPEEKREYTVELLFVLLKVRYQVGEVMPSPYKSKQSHLLPFRISLRRIHTRYRTAGASPRPTNPNDRTRTNPCHPEQAQRVEGSSHRKFCSAVLKVRRSLHALRLVGMTGVLGGAAQWKRDAP